MRLEFLFSILVFLCSVTTNSVAEDLLTLDASIAMARQFNLQIDVEKQRLHASAAGSKKAYSDTLPTVSLSSDYERFSDVNTMLNSVDLSWDSSVYAKDPAKSKNFLLKAAEEKKRMAEALLVFRVKAQYYKLMQLKQRLKVLQKGLELLEKQRATTEQFVASGLKQESALSRIDDQINTTKSVIIFKEGSISQSRLALFQLINIPDSSQKEFADCPKELRPLPDRSKVLSKVQKSAPHIQSLIFEQQSLAENIHSPWMELFPIVSLSAGYQQEWPLENDGFDVHLVLSMPITDMGKARVTNARNASLVAQKQAEIRQKRKEFADHVSILFEKAEMNKSLFLTYKKNNIHRMETLHLINREYEAGLISESDLITTQRDIIDAVFKMENAFYDYMAIVAKIEYLQGAVQ